MDNIDDHRFFLIIKKEKISFKNFDPINGSTLTKEIFLKNDSLDNIFLTLEKFLEKNMFEIEKRLKIFIKKIYIIFESDSVFEVGSSFRQNFTGVDFNYSQFNDSLIDIKNQLEKHSKKYEIIQDLMEMKLNPIMNRLKNLFFLHEILSNHILNYLNLSQKML